ncbi:cyclic nucleotide-binding domain-containing protein [Streptomyces asiaticus]
MSGEDRSPDTAPEGAAPDETPDLPDETPDLYGAFPRLTGQQIAFLSGHGTRRSVAAGEAVIREGDRGTDFLVVLSGTIAITEHHGTPDERVLRVHVGSRYSPDTRRVREFAARNHLPHRWPSTTSMTTSATPPPTSPARAPIRPPSAPHPHPHPPHTTGGERR